MLRLLVFSCALTASLGNYAGKQIDPLNPVGGVPKFKPGEVITPIDIDNVQTGPGVLPWVDESPINPFSNDQVPINPFSNDQVPINPFSNDQVPINPFSNDQVPINPFSNGQAPFMDPRINAQPLDISQGKGGQVYSNPFANGAGVQVKKGGAGYDGSRNAPLDLPPGHPAGGYVKPGLHVDPMGRKPPSYDNSHKNRVKPVIDPSGLKPLVGRKAPSYDGSHKVDSSYVAPGIAPFVGPDNVPFVDPTNPFGSGQIPFVDPAVNPNSPIRKAPSYDGSHKVPPPPLANPFGPIISPDNEIGIGSNSPFNPIGGGIVDPTHPKVRKAPSYDGSHKVPSVPAGNRFGPVVDPNYPSGADISPFKPIGGGYVDPTHPQIPGRKAPSYDGSHKLQTPPVGNPFGPIIPPDNGFGTGNFPFNPVGGGIVNQIPPVDKSYAPDNGPFVDPVNPFGTDNSPFNPIGGGIIDPINPNMPVRKAPSYDNSQKLPVAPVDNPFVDPLNPNNGLVRKAPSYDNSHKIPVPPAGGYDKTPGSPIIPGGSYPLPGEPLPGGPFPGEPYPQGPTGNGAINPGSFVDQQQRFDQMVSAHLGTKSEFSPPVLPERKKLSAGKRNYLSSLGLFNKKAKSYQS